MHAAAPRRPGANASTARKPSGTYATKLATTSNPVTYWGTGAPRNSSGDRPLSRQPDHWEPGPVADRQPVGAEEVARERRVARRHRARFSHTLPSWTGGVSR